MFDKQYRFKGRHALRVDQLTSAFDGESKAQLFGRNVDVYTNAPLVGFLYGRTAEQDDTKNPETNIFISKFFFKLDVIAPNTESNAAIIAIAK